MLFGVDVYASYILPLMLEMSEAPLKPFPLQRRIREMGIADDDESTRIIDLLRRDGLIDMMGSKNGAGVWYVVADVYLTPKGFAHLDLWPSDNERALFLLQQMVAAAEQLALESEANGDSEEKVSRLKAAARALRSLLTEVGTEIAAKVISNMATGG